jgi:NAD(P)-dependent dehydrogenase (short-subunit alcohol dehydrogenase family)
MTGRLSGRVAVVMGAGEPSAGRSSSIALAAEGAHVIAVDPSEQELSETCRLVEEAGHKVTPFVSSISDENELIALAGRCRDSFAHVDILVNCHLEARLGSIEDSTAAEWLAVISINLVGPVMCSKVFLPLMKAAGGGSIVHLGSVDGTLGNPQVSSYSASKGGLTALTHVMAEEFAPYQVRVNMIARAAVNIGPSPMIDSLMPFTPLRRPAEPSELASVVVFFASDDSSYCTGTILTVDGGRTGITPGTLLPR